jgi:hypothetical protein
MAPAAQPRPVARPIQQEPAATDDDDDTPATPQAQQPPQPVRKVEEEFTSRVYDTDNLDIPAFLRRR